MDNNDTTRMTVNASGTASGFGTFYPYGEPGGGAVSTEYEWTNQIRGSKEDRQDPGQMKKDVGIRSGAGLYKDSRGNIYLRPNGAFGRGEPVGININSIGAGQ
jgi:hypothetical protein